MSTQQHHLAERKTGNFLESHLKGIAISTDSGKVFIREEKLTLFTPLCHH